MIIAEIGGILEIVIMGKDVVYKSLCSHCIEASPEGPTEQLAYVRLLVYGRL